MRKLVVFLFLMPLMTIGQTKKVNIFNILEKYQTCDTASFLRINFTKQPEKRNWEEAKYYMSVKRMKKGVSWSAFNISNFDKTYFSIFLSDSQKVYLFTIDSAKSEFVDSRYQFEENAPPYYIWDVWRFPWNVKMVFSGWYKRLNENSEFVVFQRQGKYFTTRIYADKIHGLIQKVVSVDKELGYIDSFIYDYRYFKSKDFNYRDTTTDEKYFPLLPSNPEVMGELNKTYQRRTQWQNDRNKNVELADSNLRKIITGKHSFYLLDFWYLTCLPCKKNLISLDTIFKDCKNLDIVLVNVHDDDIDSKAYLNNTGYSFRNICDLDHSIENYYKPPAYPTTVLLDKNGKEIMRSEGLNLEDLKRIKKIVKEGSK